MLDLESLDLLGSIIGAVTGIVGAILGYIGYRRSNQIKALDLRLELRRLVADVHGTVNDLPDLLQRSRKSRDRVLAAKGTLLTGAHEQWKTTWATDLAGIEALKAELPPPDHTFKRATQDELEEKLLAVHALTSRATRVRDAYLAELDADERAREHLRSDAQSAIRRRLAKE